MPGLAGKVAIVGGSSEGIGYGIARRLAAKARDVAMVARRTEKLEARRRASATRPARGLHHRRRHPQGGRLRRASSTPQRRISAGSTSWSTTTARRRSASSMSFDDEAWDKAVQQNLMSVVRLYARRGAAHAQARRGPHRQHHRALGAAADAEVRPVGGDLGRRHRLRQDAVARSCAGSITVNTICPGRIATGRLAKVFGEGKAGGRDGADAKMEGIPVGRIGKPREIAGLVGDAGLADRRLHHRRDVFMSTAGGGRTCYEATIHETRLRSLVPGKSFDFEQLARDYPPPPDFFAAVPHVAR